MTDERKLKLLHLMDEVNKQRNTDCSICFAKNDEVTVYYFNFAGAGAMRGKRVYSHSRTIPRTSEQYDNDRMEKAEAFLKEKLKGVSV